MKAICKKAVALMSPYSLVARWPQSEHLFLHPYWINTPSIELQRSLVIIGRQPETEIWTNLSIENVHFYLKHIYWIPFRPIHCAWEVSINRIKERTKKNRMARNWITSPLAMEINISNIPAILFVFNKEHFTDGHWNLWLDNGAFDIQRDGIDWQRFRVIWRMKQSSKCHSC